MNEAPTKSMYKYEVAEMYGVGYTTFSEWLYDPSLAKKLDETGIRWRKKKLLPPLIIRIIFEHLGEP